MTPSERLRWKIGAAQQSGRAAGDRLWGHPQLAALFPELLFHAHGMMRASVPLMEAALSQAEAMADQDTVAAALVPYLARHIREEQHHDEWMLDDLEVLGKSRREVLARIPPPALAATVGAQYYWIYHCHPVALLGYIAVLEGNPPSAEVLATTRERTGLPSGAFRTYLKHADIDLHHREDLYRAIDALPVTSFHESLMGLSAMQAVAQIDSLTSAMVDRFERRSATERGPDAQQSETAMPVSNSS